MNRAYGVVAEACAAVIAAEVQQALNLTNREARAIGRAAVDALRTDGWYITCRPMTPLPLLQPGGTAPDRERQP